MNILYQHIMFLTTESGRDKFAELFLGHLFILKTMKVLSKITIETRRIDDF